MQDGVYRAEAIGASLGYTSSGAEQVRIQFEFLDEDGNPTGQWLTYYGYFTEKAQEHTLKALRTAGWRGTDLADLSSVGDEQTPEVSLVVKNETYNGVTRAKIQWVNAAGGLGMKDQLDPSEAQSFAAKMRGAVLAFDQKNGGAKKATQPSPRRSSPQPSQQPDPPPITDDPPFS